jgi:hypothetical protein
MDLGRGSSRGVRKTYGIRRAVWDFAFGYVSGIPLRSIAYYLATRSFNRHVARWAMKREGTHFDGWLPVVSVEVEPANTQTGIVTGAFASGGMLAFEPSEGPEYFIPTGASSRSRSKAIHDEVLHLWTAGRAEARRKHARRAARAGMRRAIP